MIYWEPPKKVKGLLVDYKVAVERPLTDGAAAAFENNGKGFPIIRVSPSLQGEFRFQAFLHELIHAAEFEQGVNLKDDDSDSDVDRLAMSLAGFWLRNKWALPGE